jgi:hypothetical protein
MTILRGMSFLAVFCGGDSGGRPSWSSWGGGLRPSQGVPLKSPFTPRNLQQRPDDKAVVAPEVVSVIDSTRPDAG